MAEAVGQVGGGVDVELVVFEKPLTLFVHGNTFPRHRRDLPSRKCYLCLENMCYRCPEKILLPMSWSRSFNSSIDPSRECDKSERRRTFDRRQRLRNGLPFLRII